MSLSHRNTEWSDYELIDFGEGRKLERLGSQLFDRPSPQAEGHPLAIPDLWPKAAARYSGTQVGSGRWKPAKLATQAAPLACLLAPGKTFRLTIDPTPAGQLGVFPEQFANWQWIVQQVEKLRKIQPSEPIRLLNLFGYTGASTLAAAVAGVEVTHVDASKPAVAAARANAQLSGLAEAPIRWIVEDVVKYCRREVKRGQQYHAVVLDPPTYGHGPAGEEWRLTRDLLPLLELCRELTSDHRRFLLATCHTPGVGPAELAAYLAEGLFGHCGQPAHSGELTLATRDGRQLESGVFARWPQ